MTNVDEVMQRHGSLPVDFGKSWNVVTCRGGQAEGRCGAGTQSHRRVRGGGALLGSQVLLPTRMSARASAGQRGPVTVICWSVSGTSSTLGTPQVSTPRDPAMTQAHGETGGTVQRLQPPGHFRAGAGRSLPSVFKRKSTTFRTASVVGHLSGGHERKNIRIYRHTGERPRNEWSWEPLVLGAHAGGSSPGVSLNDKIRMKTRPRESGR